MPEYYLFLYFEKNDKPLTVWELYDGVWKDFGWVDYRMSREYIEETVENLSRWFVMNDDGEISFVGKRDKMFEYHVHLSKKYLSDKRNIEPMTYHYLG